MKIYEVLKANGLTDGFNFDAKNCRPSNTLENSSSRWSGYEYVRVWSYRAAVIIKAGWIEAFVQQKYASFRETELSKKILKNEMSIKDLTAYADKVSAPQSPMSGKRENLEALVNVEKIIYPDEKVAGLYSERYKVFKKMYLLLKNIYQYFE